MVENNRIENLSKEKPAHHEYGQYYSIPQEKIDKLFILLANDLPITNAAKEVGIKFETAKKYFDFGDPRRGIQPLKKRLAILRYKRTEKMDADLVRRQRYLLAVTRRMIKKIRKELLDEAYKKGSYSALESMIKLELLLSNRSIEKSEEAQGIFSAEDIKTLSQKAEQDIELLEEIPKEKEDVKPTTTGD